MAFLIVAILLASIFAQLHWMAIGLQQFDALIIVPIFQCFFISVSILGGGVYFDELSKLSAVQASMFTFGVLLTLIGVAILSSESPVFYRPLRVYVQLVPVISMS